MEALPAYYSNYIPQSYNIPLILTEWKPIIPNFYTTPVQHLTLPVASSQIITLCPYASALVTTEPLVTITSDEVTADSIPICNDVYNEIYYEPVINYTEEIVSPLIDVQSEYNLNEEQISETTNKTENKDTDAVELYLNLPKELFPKPNMLSIDPNPIIDEFCKIENISENVPWILDLEFGVPKIPVTRAIATYDVKFNSIHCKNTPNAIHPGFEKCSGDFKRIILIYYDCIVSNWYNGFIFLSHDQSVENFQSWLLIPMQIFGMCWA